MFLLRMLQRGEMLSKPNSRPMPSIGKNCHELRIIDSPSDLSWRIIYKIESNGILLIYIFAKKTRKTPNEVIRLCKQRLRIYEQSTKKE